MSGLRSENTCAKRARVWKNHFLSWGLLFAKWTSSFAYPIFCNQRRKHINFGFFRTTPREIASFWKPTPKSLDKWFMKNRIVCRTFLRKTQGKLLWENEFFIRQIALLCNIPWDWCILLGPAYLKNPWNNSICLIFEMLKSLHEDWNCTARRCLQPTYKRAWKIPDKI